MSSQISLETAATAIPKRKRSCLQYARFVFSREKYVVAMCRVILIMSVGGNTTEKPNLQGDYSMWFLRSHWDRSEPNARCKLLCIPRTRVPTSVAERSMVWVCGRSFARIACSNPAGGMDVRVLCVVGYRSLRRVDSSSRGVLPTVV